MKIKRTINLHKLSETNIIPAINDMVAEIFDIFSQSNMIHLCSNISMTSHHKYDWDQNVLENDMEYIIYTSIHFITNNKDGKEENIEYIKIKSQNRLKQILQVFWNDIFTRNLNSIWESYLTKNLTHNKADDLIQATLILSNIRTPNDKTIIKEDIEYQLTWRKFLNN